MLDMASTSSVGSNEELSAVCEGRLETHARHPVYHDYADKDLQWILQRVVQDQEQSRRSVMGPKSWFPAKLHEAVETCSASSDLSTVLSWLPHGRAFKIFDRARFVSEVLPQYFQSQKAYGSFQRQLNMYGFLKLTGNHVDHGAYYHPFFLRGRVSLCELLTRPTQDGTAVRRAYDPNSEPDFYRLPPVRHEQWRPSQPILYSGTPYGCHGNTPGESQALMVVYPPQSLRHDLLLGSGSMPADQRLDSFRHSWPGLDNSTGSALQGSAMPLRNSVNCGDSNSSGAVSTYQSSNPFIASQQHIGACGEQQSKPATDGDMSALQDGTVCFSLRPSTECLAFQNATSHTLNHDSLSAAAPTLRNVNIQTLHRHQQQIPMTAAIPSHELPTTADNGSNALINNLGITMSEEDAFAPCDRDVYRAMFKDDYLAYDCGSEITDPEEIEYIMET